MGDPVQELLGSLATRKRQLDASWNEVYRAWRNAQETCSRWQAKQNAARYGDASPADFDVLQRAMPEAYASYRDTLDQRNLRPLLKAIEDFREPIATMPIPILGDTARKMADHVGRFAFPSGQGSFVLDDAQARSRAGSSLARVPSSLRESSSVLFNVFAWGQYADFQDKVSGPVLSLRAIVEDAFRSVQSQHALGALSKSDVSAAYEKVFSVYRREVTVRLRQGWTTGSFGNFRTNTANWRVNRRLWGMGERKGLCNDWSKAIFDAVNRAGVPPQLKIDQVTRDNETNDPLLPGATERYRHASVVVYAVNASRDDGVVLDPWQTGTAAIYPCREWIRGGHGGTTEYGGSF